MGPVSAVFGAVALLAAALVGLSLLRNPVIRRSNLRNMARRKNSTLLVIIGSMVGTAIIAGYLIIRDTSGRLNQDLAYRYLGEVDEVVSLPGPQGDSTLYFDRQPIADRVTVGSLNAKTEATNNAALVHRAIAVFQEQVPLRKVDPVTGEALLIEPRAALLALDWEGLAGFGRRPHSPTRPALGEVIASEGLARELELVPGDTVEELAGGSVTPLR